jgi:transposase
MRPSTWQPPVETSAAEDRIIKRIKRARLFIFLRRHRHQILTPEFQIELAGIYKDSPQGSRRLSPRCWHWR